MSGCIVKARAIGAREARQKKKDGDWVRNDRLIVHKAGAST
jgi:hypothetical protein